MILTTENADEAAVFTASFFSGANAGVTLSSLVSAATESDPEVIMALNLGNQGEVVTYYANDNGSTFNIAVANPAGIQGVAVENANGPVEFYNIQGVRVNPETAGPGLYIRRQGNKAVKVLVR